jgi:hypothetical protein
MDDPATILTGLSMAAYCAVVVMCGDSRFSPPSEPGFGRCSGCWLERCYSPRYSCGLLSSVRWMVSIPRYRSGRRRFASSRVPEPPSPEPYDVSAMAAAMAAAMRDQAAVSVSICRRPALVSS